MLSLLFDLRTKHQLFDPTKRGTKHKQKKNHQKHKRRYINRRFLYILNLTKMYSIGKKYIFNIISYFTELSLSFGFDFGFISNV